MEEEPGVHYYAGVKEGLRGADSKERELPVRGEVVRIVSGALAGEEAMVEAVEREPKAGRTLVSLRIYGFPWPIEEPAYAVARGTAEFGRFTRNHRREPW